MTTASTFEYLPISSSSEDLPQSSNNSKLSFAFYNPKRWSSPAFVCYYMLIISALVLCLRETWRVSNLKTFPRLAKYLAPGWMYPSLLGNRPIDMADVQYKGFREGLPMLAAGLFIYLLLANIFPLKWSKVRNATRLVLAIAFIAALHGVIGLSKILLLLIGFFVVAKSVTRPWICWLYAIATLVVMERGISRTLTNFIDSFLSDILATILTLPSPSVRKFVLWGAYPRWNIVFKCSILRMLSFGLDYCELVRGKNSSSNRPHGECYECSSNAGIPCHKKLSMTPLSDRGFFTWSNMLFYVLYPPLFLAGPICTFNAFMHMNVQRQRTLGLLQVFFYGIRAVGAFLLLELILHSLWVVAIKEAKIYQLISSIPALWSVSFVNLLVVWLKLLVIWRFGRWMSIVDGLDRVPENMLRCMCNNYSLLGFWRQWHHSFNQWIIRYMYVPLGGSGSAWWNVWPIFSFVALWHDIRPDLLAWAWLICLFIAPELLCTKLIAPWLKKKLVNGKGSTFSSLFYEHFCAVAAAFNILFMISANLVGFVTGIDGGKELLHKLFLTKAQRVEALSFATYVLATFYGAARIMFLIRAREEFVFGKHLNY